MPPIYRIHPAIGIARLGNSPDEFYISPEAPAALPIECNPQGETTRGEDGRETTVTTFKDREGRVKRQAARFQVWVYDDDCPGGRPLELNDPVAGGGYQGTLVDVEWRVWLANKKSAWYEFKQLDGEHGYAPDHPRRNPDIKGKTARRRLIIDPGPRTVSQRGYRTAEFSRAGAAHQYAPTFPPRLRPHSIQTLGRLMTDAQGRLLVLGGHGNAGTFSYKQFGQPRIDHYANNDGWFDDTSDGPVMARLVLQQPGPGGEPQLRFVDVEYPAWVVAGYPGYCPEILDMITMDDVLQDLQIRQFATRTDLYGQSGTFAHPQHVDPMDPQALTMWRAGRLQWNPDYRPWFYRDIWNILFRPDQFSYLTDILGLSNFPHNQSTRGTFDPEKLGTPPRVNWRRVHDEERRLVGRLLSGDLFMEGLEPLLERVEKQARTELAAQGPAGEAVGAQLRGMLTGGAAEALQASVAAFAAALGPAAAEGGAALPDPGTAPDALAGAGTLAQPGPREGDPAAAASGSAAAAGTGPLDPWLRALRQAGPRPELAEARDELERRVAALLDALPGSGGAKGEAAPHAKGAVPAEGGGDGAARVLGRAATRLRKGLQDHLRKLHTGRLLDEARRAAIAAHTVDEYRAYRQFLYDLLRRSGEENRFFAGGKPDARTHNLPLMPLLSGDNPISNALVSKFLRLTDYQLYLVRQWADGLFHNEADAGWCPPPDPWNPYAGWQNRTGQDLDRGVISQVAGGAFCPGCELGWVMRNPSIFYDVSRIKADPTFYAFQETAAQANQTAGGGQGPGTSEPEFSSYIQKQLSLRNDFTRGLQPGDLTKYMAVPWQADFNECSTEVIDVTYDGWNKLYPASDRDEQLAAADRQWETLWWPAHRPMQVFVEVPGPDGQPPSWDWQVWALGIPQTSEGDYKMVTDWWRLGFVIKNAKADPDMSGDISPPQMPPPYISVEAHPGHLEEEE